MVVRAVSTVRGDHKENPPTFLTQRPDGDLLNNVGVHEQALLSTASLDDFEILRSIGAGNNGQIFEVACTIPQACTSA